MAQNAAPAKAPSSKRWVLWAVAAVLLAGVVYLVTKPSMPTSGDVNGAQFEKLAAQGVRVIDVRTAVEYNGGHIPGAENVPVDDLPGAAGSWSRSEPIAVYCLSGERSANAMGYLKAQGFATVYNLAGGIGSWKGEIVKGEDPGKKPGSIQTSGKPRMIEFSSST